MSAESTWYYSLSQAIDLNLGMRGLNTLKNAVKAQIKSPVKRKLYSEIEKEVIGTLAKSIVSQEFKLVVVENTPGGYMFRHGDDDQLHSSDDTYSILPPSTTSNHCNIRKR